MYYFYIDTNLWVFRRPKEKSFRPENLMRIGHAAFFFPVLMFMIFAAINTLWSLTSVDLFTNTSLVMISMASLLGPFLNILRANVNLKNIKRAISLKPMKTVLPYGRPPDMPVHRIHFVGAVALFSFLIVVIGDLISDLR